MILSVSFVKSTQRIETTNGNFYFQAKSFDEKESWIGSIGKVMIQGSRKNIFINEEDDDDK